MLHLIFNAAKVAGLDNAADNGQATDKIKPDLTNFQQAPFLAASNIYAVNMRQYTPEGTFDAFARHLPRLKDMGVEILWLMPIHPIGKLNRKGTLGSYYSITDYTDVNPEYGTLSDFHELVAQIHSLGMRVILDWVANHTAWDNVWTISHPEFYEKDAQGNFKPPYDWEDVLQIDHGSAGEQQAMIDAMKYWVTDFNIDGFRADLAHLTPLPFWINARTQLTPLKENLIWLAETEHINYHEAFDISFSWKWMHDTEDYCKGQKTINDLLATLRHYANDFPATALRMYFTSNHDENSWCGTEFEKYGIWAKNLAVFSHTWCGVSMLYTGQELPVTRRLKFFDKDTIDWSAGIQYHDFYKTLLQLRKSNSALQAGLNSFPVIIKADNEQKVLAFFRKSESACVIVLLNMDNQPLWYQFNARELHGTYKDVFSGESFQLTDEGTIFIDTASYRILEGIA